MNLCVTLRRTVLVSLFLAPIAVTSRAADCGKLLDTFDREGKEMSLEKARITGDNSVYRSIAAEMRINNLLLSRQINLTLMIQAHCPLPEHPVWPDDYTMPALKCATEELKGNYQSSECDIKKWKSFNE